MRLASLEVSGFRAFGGSYRFDLSADMLVIHGPNGSGKTSLLDAILWAVTGGVDRLGKRAEVVSEYAEFGEAHVELTLVGTDGKQLQIARRQARGEPVSTLALHTGDEDYSGAIAEARLMELLWPEGMSAEDPQRSLARSFTRAVYLQQDQVRSFVQDTDEQGRFDIVSEIVGAGRVQEMIRNLEVSRKAWTTSTNRLRDQELTPLIQRRDRLASALAHAKAAVPDASVAEAEWNAWVASTTAALGAPNSDSGSRSLQLESMLAGLREANRAAEHRLARLDELTTLRERLPPPVVTIGPAEQRVSDASLRVAERETALAIATDQASLFRQQMVEQAGERDALAAMARVALNHLTDTCPVCEQTYDRAHTVEHLEALVAAASTPIVEPTAGTEEAARLLREAEDERTLAEAALRQARRDEQDRKVAVGQIHALAESLALEPELSSPHLEEERTLARTQAAITSALRKEGELLSAKLAQLEQGRRASELAAQLPALEHEVAKLTEDIDLRVLAGEDAIRLHDAVRSLSERLVAEELKSIEPLLQRIYASVDPHPTFRAVKLLTNRQRGRGQLWTTIEDEARNKSVSDPTAVLSSSQLNVLAVSTFMAMNLSARVLPLEVAALDDPLQSLDNVNLLGLADLLRRTRSQRQIIISTHDDRLVGLLERKLRPVGPDQRTIMIHMDGWEPNGPIVVPRDLAQDIGTPRLLRSVG